MTNAKSSMNDKNQKYDLCERTKVFSVNLLRFLRGLRQDSISKPILGQLVRSATSVGANYREADGAESKKDFQHKIGICKKESKETEYWLELLSTIYLGEKEELRIFWKEAHEFTLIFSKIILNSQKKKE